MHWRACAASTLSCLLVGFSSLLQWPAATGFWQTWVETPMSRSSVVIFVSRLQALHVDPNAAPSLARDLLLKVFSPTRCFRIGACGCSLRLGSSSLSSTLLISASQNTTTHRRQKACTKNRIKNGSQKYTLTPYPGCTSSGPRSPLQIHGQQSRAIWS